VIVMVSLCPTLRRAAQLPLLTLALAVLAGCGGEVRLNAGFVEDLSRAIGHSGEDVRLPQSTLDELARQAEVDSGVVARSAERASEPAVVRSTATTLNDDLGDDVAKGAALELACDYLQNPHQITWGEVFSALGTSFSDAGKPRAQQVYDAAQELEPDLEDAQNSTDPDERTAVVIMCFYAQNAT
jgi:hypothetical protein